MLEKYLQFSKEKNKLSILLLKHEETKENMPFFVLQLIAFIVTIPVFILNTLFSFDLFEYTEFLENNGFSDFLYSLQNPSVFNGDFSFIYNEMHMTIAQKYEYLSNINLTFIAFFSILFLLAHFFTFKTSKNKQYIVHNSLNWSVQALLAFSFIWVLFMTFFIDKDIISFMKNSELILLDERHHPLFLQLYYFVKSIKYMYLFNALLLPFIFIVMGTSIKNLLKNIKKNKKLNKSQDCQKLKKDIYECQIEIDKLKEIILNDNDEKKNILNKLKDNNSEDEHKALMELVNIELNSLSPSEQKVTLFTEKKHEINYMENR